MARPPAFQLYVKSWLSSTAPISLEAQGAYMRLLCWSWDNGPLPVDGLARARLVGLTRSRFDRVWSEFAEKWVHIDTGLVNLRLEQQRTELDAYHQRQSKAGKASAAKRQPGGNQKATTVTTNGQPEGKSVSVSATASTPAKIKTVSDGAFDAFWGRYPNRKGKDKALKAWAKLHPDADLLSAISSALDWQVNQPQWRKDGGAFVPHASTWLNGRRWEDEPFHAPSEADDPNADVFARVAGGPHGDRR